MSREILLSHFKKLNCVVDYTILKEYVNFCIEKSLPHYIKSETANHHILPMAKTLPFREYSNLNEYPWNKSILLHKDHYYAHYLLYKAVNHYSIIYSFCAMHNKDFKNQKLEKHHLINDIEFQKIFKERNEKISEDMNSLVNFDGNIMSKAKMIAIKRHKNESNEIKAKRSERLKGDNNLVYKPGVIEKIRKTKKDKNLDKVSAINASKTMSKIYKDENGNDTTIYAENGKKISKHLNKIIKLEDGSITTIAKQKARIKGDAAIAKGKFYKVFNVFDPTYEEILSAIEVRKISPGLEKKNKENFLGKSKFGITTLTKKNKSHLIGLYVEEL